MTIVISVMNHLGTLIKIQWLYMCTLLCPLIWVSLLSLKLHLVLVKESFAAGGWRQYILQLYPFPKLLWLLQFLCFPIYFLASAFKKKIICLSAVLGLYCCVQVFSICGKRGLLSSCAALRLFNAGASLFAGHGLCACMFQSSWCVASVLVVHGISCSAACGIFPD